MDDAEQTVTIRGVVSTGPPVVTWGDDRDAGASPEPSGPAADTAAGLASLSFITAAIRRGTRAWCLAAVIGLLLGAAMFKLRPPAYQATIQVYLTLAPYENPVTAIPRPTRRWPPAIL